MLITIVGWIGTILILVAYLLVSNKKLEGNSRMYQVLNLFGAIGVGLNVWHQHAWPAVALQATWGLIAIIALVRSGLAKKEYRTAGE